jgi:tol-pal system protein YbgF
VKKYGIILLLLVFASCTANSEKTQSEYFKDFQTQLLGLSQRIETVEAKSKKETVLGGDIYGRVDRIEDQLTQIDGSLSKLKANPLFDGIETVKLAPAPTSTVITIKSDAVYKVAEPPVVKSAETVVQLPAVSDVAKEELKPVREEKKAKEAPVAAATGQKDKISALYGQGYEMYSAGKFAQAVSIFRNFLQNYPSDNLADNAQYWIAECYYSQKMFEKAIVEFKKVENYPDKNKVPDAYLKISYAYAELGKKEDAAKWKKLLLNKYKDSEAAKKVQ